MYYVLSKVYCVASNIYYVDSLRPISGIMQPRVLPFIGDALLAQVAIATETRGLSADRRSRMSPFIGDVLLANAAAAAEVRGLLAGDGGRA